MRVVSENSEEEIAAQRAEDEALRCLKKLAGELIRIVRGAGKPGMVEQFTGTFLDAASEYRATTGRGLSIDRITAALEVRQEPSEQHPIIFKGEFAREMVISGALQVAASRLLEDSLRENKGDSEVLDGMQGWMDSRETIRKALAKERREELSQSRIKRRPAAKASRKPK